MTKKEKSGRKKEIKKRTPKWFYFILFLLPVIFIILLELSLRLFDYGDNPDEWISLSNDIEILNPEVSNRYFSGINNTPFSTESFLYSIKPKDSFRIVVLGASSGAGYPYQNSASFSKYIRKGLRLIYPDRTIEVSNISMAAVNSYTMLDLLPGVINKNPDLILIYLGHNEYYGALGAASSQSFASSAFVTKLILNLNDFRIVQLLKNIIAGITASVSISNTDDGTLMSQVAAEKLIELNSSLYKAGIEQFRNNLEDIFRQCKEHNIPVIISTLASNVKDRPPFNPLKQSIYPDADNVYESAKIELAENNFSEADSLFTYAKDLDGLRFRAPEDINKAITSLADDYRFSVANSEYELKIKSGNFIIGDELMTDHLHPNVFGYQIIGETFLREIVSKNYLNEESDTYPTLDSLNQIIRSNYNFTKYDSTIADFRIKILKNDWPYVSPDKKLPRRNILNAETFEDKIALDVLDNKISRGEARLKLADKYIAGNNYKLYADEIISFTEEFPISNKHANEAANKLMSVKEFQLAEKVLLASYFVQKDEFNTKWLGAINLSEKNFNKSIKYLKQSRSLNNSDPQVLFNLAAAYSSIKNYKSALQIINECLIISPDYSNAINLKTQLEKVSAN